MTPETIGQVTEALKSKPEGWLKFVLAVWSNPQKSHEQCAIECGISPKSAKVRASQILSNPAVKKAMKILQEEAVKKAVGDLDWWVNEQKEILDYCKTVDDIVLYDKDGNPVVDKTKGEPVVLKRMRDATNANKSLDSIAKAMGHYIPKGRENGMVVVINTNYG